MHMKKMQVYQQVQDPGGQGFEARETQSQVLQQTDQNFHPEQHTQEQDVTRVEDGDF